MDIKLNEKLIKYCELIVKKGLNVQKGQRIMISSPVECFEFARIMAEEAYKAGAKQVIMEWSDEQIARSGYLNADPSIFDVCDPWIVTKYDTLSAEGAGFLSISARNPEAFKGIDTDLMQRGNRSSRKAMKDYHDRMMGNKAPWCVVSIPTAAWAMKVFPNAENAECAMNLLWDEILKSSRVDDGNAIENWTKHNDTIKARANVLNNYDFAYINAKASNGTDLQIELPEGHIWCGGDEECPVNDHFSPNIPTEEIFSAPKKTGVNGVVKSTKPLLYQGNLIDDFTIWFENGKAVKYEAKSGYDNLKSLIETDETSCYLGEIALVPYNSPISLSGILFYNTLYDENASCHLALGRAYPMCIKDSDGKSDGELVEMGLNYSISHSDFMFGTKDMSISGVTKDGKTVQIFENGNFTF